MRFIKRLVMRSMLTSLLFAPEAAEIERRPKHNKAHKPDTVCTSKQVCCDCAKQGGLCLQCAEQQRKSQEADGTVGKFD